jgi:hypothetical protein
MDKASTYHPEKGLLYTESSIPPMCAIRSHINTLILNGFQLNDDHTSMTTLSQIPSM